MTVGRNKYGLEFLKLEKSWELSDRDDSLKKVFIKFGYKDKTSPRIFPYVLKLPTGPIGVANSFGWEEKAS